MIQLKNINLSLGTKQIFSDINLLLHSDQKIGVVGRNGAGKSTLLKLISKDLKQNSGSITFDKNKTLAYMSQDLTLTSQKNIFEEAFSVFEDLNSIELRTKEIEEKLNNQEATEELIEEYAKLQEKLSLFDKSKAIAKAEFILLGLGFEKENFDKPVSTLSVGWKMRLVLAQLLLKEADFYLFDEPTNHLDIQAQDWFFDFLNNSNFGFLLVSHDRYFLDKACNNILEIEREKATIYTGNYTNYLGQKEKRQEILEATYKRQQKEIEQKKKTIEKFRASASKAKMAQSLIKQLDKMEIVNLELEQSNISLRFPEIKRSGNQVLTIKNLAQAFKDKIIFKNISFDIKRSEKIALIAPNGKGKTTLLNTIVNKYKPINGQVDFGYNVEWSYFEQYQLESLNSNNTIFDEIRNSGISASDSSIRSFLGNFLFSGDDIEKKIAVLSGGERNRVALVKLLLQQANFLILDEPTNHLDIFSKEALAQALKQYSGTVLLVSHDHCFLDSVANRILELEQDKIIDYSGTYSEYKEHKRILNSLNNNQEQSKSSDLDFESQKKENKQNKQENKELKKEIKFLENKIKKLENSIEQVNKKFFEIEYGSKEYFKVADKLKLTEKDLEVALNEWEKLFAALES